FRLQSDRVASVNHKSDGFDVFVRPDTARSPFRYLFYRDLNGWYQLDNLENINPFWQSDYAKVHFTFLPQSAEELSDYDIYLYGELTNWMLTESNRLTWNDNTQAYETDLMLKNGYYSYSYVTVPKKQPRAVPSFKLTEGTVWDAENNYTILVYFRSFGSRADELVGYTEVSSLNFLGTGR
ncbi:MAG TPA: DUF5103 domain-containing protein, partial [Phnomibacter sp.]|nr:DUF5103 domain-containing protein [Phnomibacter sp.]